MTRIHTPYHYDGHGINDSEGLRLATIEKVNFPREPDRAPIGKLLAAAPDMLEALQGLLADKYLTSPINADRMRAACAAIAKATGA